MRTSAVIPIVLVASALGACRNENEKPNAPATVEPSPEQEYFCDLPGSLRFTETGVAQVSGGNADVLSFLTLPAGFCAHYYGNVGNTRQLAFAPGGELFVASPTMGTTGGGRGGLSAIVILPDDDHDGVSDSTLTYLDNLPATQGMLFADGYFYYQDQQKILRRPYAKGERAPQGTSDLLASIDLYYSSLHWPKPIAQADDGTIYVGNGGDQNESCDFSRPFHGGILKLDGSPGGTPVAKGLRNPISIRCQRGHNVCFAVELAMDYSGGLGGREKLVPIREGDDFGFPCCLTQDIPVSNMDPVPDCALTTPEDVSFVIGDTPFPFDFEPGNWGAPYTGAAFVPLHGAAGGWEGARIVAIEVDPSTGMPKPGTNLPGVSPGAMSNFATGWDDRTRAHGRPATIAFAPDGRMFVGNDNDGNIFWVAPLTLRRPSE